MPTWLRRASILACRACFVTPPLSRPWGPQLADTHRERRAAPTKSLGDSSIPTRPLREACSKSGQSVTLHPCLHAHARRQHVSPSCCCDARRPEIAGKHSIRAKADSPWTPESP